MFLNISGGLKKRRYMKMDLKFFYQDNICRNLMSDIKEVRKEEEFWRGRKIQGENMSNMRDPSVISKAKGGSQRKSINSCLGK